MGKAMIWSPTKGLVGGGGKWGRATMGKTRVKYIYICRHKYIDKLIIAIIMKEILTKIPKNLGASPVLGVRCEWIATAAMLAGGVVSSLFGGAKARREAKKRRESGSTGQRQKRHGTIRSTIPTTSTPRLGKT